MAIITMSADLRCARGCRVEQISADALTTSDPAGTSQARLYGLPKWALSLVSPEALTDAQAGVWKALLLGLRGQVNYLAAFDPARPVPLGTLRGALTLAAAAAYGDNTASITGGAGQAGKTLQAGDWLQLGTGLGSSQLVCCTANAVADGTGLIAVTFEPTLRLGFALGATVAWDHARAYYRRTPARAGWAAYSGRITQVMNVDLIEAWE